MWLIGERHDSDRPCINAGRAGQLAAHVGDVGARAQPAQRRIGVFWIPALFDVQDGVTACPVNHLATPEICQLLNSCTTGMFVSSGMM